MDPNNNFSSCAKGYSLRPRTSSRKCDEDDNPVEAEAWRPSRTKKNQKSVPLSKYRRKTANARERSRMREINEAFETLRRVIPQVPSRECSSEKMTKITTLRLAMKYISALDCALRDQDLSSPFSDYSLTLTSPGPDLCLSPLLPHDPEPPLVTPDPPLAIDSCLSGPLFTPVDLECSNALEHSQFFHDFG